MPYATLQVASRRRRTREVDETWSTVATPEYVSPSAGLERYSAIVLLVVVAGQFSPRHRVSLFGAILPNPLHPQPLPEILLYRSFDPTLDLTLVDSTPS